MTQTFSLALISSLPTLQLFYCKEITKRKGKQSIEKRGLKIKFVKGVPSLWSCQRFIPFFHIKAAPVDIIMLTIAQMIMCDVKETSHTRKVTKNYHLTVPSFCSYVKRRLCMLAIWNLKGYDLSQMHIHIQYLGLLGLHCLFSIPSPAPLGEVINCGKFNESREDKGIADCNEPIHGSSVSHFRK